jgi:putative ABC transport system permease protein
MVKNYLIVTLRGFSKQRFFALLNMSGLALGIASAIFIFLYIKDELRYDKIHPFINDTYRIGAIFKNNDGRQIENTSSPGFWVKHLMNTRSEVLAGTRVDFIGYPTQLHIKSVDKIILTEQAKWVESNFHEILAFDLVKGNPKKILSKNSSMVISESGAIKLFGTLDPIGQIVSVRHPFVTQGKDIELEITGVYKDYPLSSHFKPHYIFNVNALRQVVKDFDNYMEGVRYQEVEFFENYVVLKHGTNYQSIDSTLKVFARDLGQFDSGFVARGWTLVPFLTKLSDIHFDQKNSWENDSPQGNKQYLLILGLVAILVLLIAAINYMNLATARSLRRAKEVGLRKSLGGTRFEIAIQFYCESLLMTIGALFIALVLVIVFLQPFNDITSKAFTFSSLFDGEMMSIIVGIVLFTVFVSGSYPALYLSSFQPSKVLKGQVAKGKSAEFFRKALIGIQFAASFVIIVSTAVVITQMDLLQDSKLNQNGDQLLCIRYGGIAPPEKFSVFKESVLRETDLNKITIANHLPRQDYFERISATVKFPDISDQELKWSQLNCDFSFAKTFNLEFVAGHDFDETSIADSTSVLLNETAVKILNRPIDEIIGTSIIFSNDRTHLYKVVGVVKDFPIKSMRQVIEPLVINPKPHSMDRIVYIQIQKGKVGEKIQQIEKVWKQVFPGIGFDYWFISDEFDRMYISEDKINSLSKIFAVLAIIITSFGVFGLASYSVEQKAKEVGVRKVLGASPGQMIGMFLWIFIKILIVSCAIAAPLSYLINNYWLQSFAYHTRFSPLTYAFSTLILALVTLAAIFYEMLKVLRINPAITLRNE